MSGVGKIDNGQSAMTENEAGLLIGPDAIVIGSTMLQTGDHATGDGGPVASAALGAINETDDAAHARFPFAPNRAIRIFITCSSVIQQSSCYRLISRLKLKQKPEGIDPWRL
jgi:hypothetical protein